MKNVKFNVVLILSLVVTTLSFGQTKMVGGAEMYPTKNIIENAIKHGAVNGLVRVEVGDNWISFSDNGPGIDKKNQTLALQAFWRNNQSNNDGSGLGLAIVNEICKAHNATLTIERSISLKGAEITIQF